MIERDILNQKGKYCSVRDCRVKAVTLELCDLKQIHAFLNEFHQIYATRCYKTGDDCHLFSSERDA